MASRRYDPIKTQGMGRVSIAGSFRPNGTGTPTVVKGHGWSVERASIGLYTITVTDPFVAFERALCSARVSDGTANLVQMGDWDSAARTLQIRTFAAGAAAATSRSIPLDLLSARAVTGTKVVDWRDIGAVVLGSTPPTFNATVGGYAFDADAESVWLHARVPTDWTSGTNMSLALVWHPQAGAAIANTETVKWVASYYARAAGEAVDGGTVETATVTYTQSGAGTDKAEIRSVITIASGAANQPLAAGDSLYIQLQRDKTGDTYASDAIITRFELAYTTSLSPIVGIQEPGNMQPYVERVNGATDPTLRLVWPAGVITAVQFAPVQWPQDLDATQDVTFSASMQMSGVTDTPTVALGAFENLGDTNFGGNTSPLSDAVANKTVTLAAGDITAYPSFVNLLLTPDAHNTDNVALYGAQLTYQSSGGANAFALVDMADDPDNVVNFEATFINTSCDYT